jgi:hypothetical protein
MTYNKDDSQVLEYRVNGYTEVLLCAVISTSSQFKTTQKITHQTLGTSINNNHQRKTNREPLFSIGRIEIPERYQSQSF